MAQSAPQVVIDRATDGTLTFDWSVNDVAGSGTGFWDDATPLPVGVYEAFNHVTTINGGVAQNTIRLDTSSLGRNNIIIHGGSQTSSEGCFIINASDRNAMFNAITTAGYELGDLTVNVRGDVGYQVDISTSASVEEGGALSCTVSLSGAGAADGLLRDLNVRVSLSGSAANPIDFTLGAGALSVPTSGGAAAGANEFWITIPAGQSSATALLPTVFDNVTEGNETAVFTVADLQFVRNGNRVYQPDTRQAVEALIGSKTDSSEIVDKDSILGKDVNANGGVEGYDEVHNFAPGQSVNVFFDPYTIPDSLTISDVTTGRSYVNTGFIGGSSYSGSFTIDKASRRASN